MSHAASSADAAGYAPSYDDGLAYYVCTFVLNWSGRTGGEVALQFGVRPQEEEPKKKRELKKKNAAFSGDFPILEATVDPRGCGGQRQSSSAGFQGGKKQKLDALQGFGAGSRTNGARD